MADMVTVLSLSLRSGLGKACWKRPGIRPWPPCAKRCEMEVQHLALWEKHVVFRRQGVGFDANWTPPVNGVICTTNDSGYHSHVLVVFLWLTPSSFVCAFIVSISYRSTVTAMVMAGLFYRLFMVINPLAILRIFLSIMLTCSLRKSLTRSTIAFIGRKDLMWVGLSVVLIISKVPHGIQQVKPSSTSFRSLSIYIKNHAEPTYRVVIPKFLGTLVQLLFIGRKYLKCFTQYEVFSKQKPMLEETHGNGE